MSWKFTVRQIRRVVLGLIMATALVTGGAYFVATQRKASEQAPLPPQAARTAS